MRLGFKEFHAANRPSMNRSQHGQVCLTLHWVLISKTGTETRFGNDPADEKSLTVRNMSSKALPAPICACTAKLGHKAAKKP